MLWDRLAGAISGRLKGKFRQLSAKGMVL
jgi:hypothetical protein